MPTMPKLQEKILKYLQETVLSIKTNKTDMKNNQIKLLNICIHNETELKNQMGKENSRQETPERSCIGRNDSEMT